MRKGTIFTIIGCSAILATGAAIGTMFVKHKIAEKKEKDDIKELKDYVENLNNVIAERENALKEKTFIKDAAAKIKEYAAKFQRDNTEDEEAVRTPEDDESYDEEEYCHEEE